MLIKFYSEFAKKLSLSRQRVILKRMTSILKRCRRRELLGVITWKGASPMGFLLLIAAVGCASLNSAQSGSENPTKDENNVSISTDESAGFDANRVAIEDNGEENPDALAEGEDGASDPDALAEEGDEGVQEDLGEGFCKDDIYTQYLTRHFGAHASKIPVEHVGRGKHRHKSVSSQRRGEAESLNFARSRLVGPVAPYFGSLPVVANARVEYWIRYFKGEGRKAFLKWLVRGESLKGVVKPLLKTEGLPPELFFLAMVESGFSNQAYSRAKATGPWQFMNGTAKLYGLRINYWVDERRDPIKSTIAAARYLRDLYAEFGDWYLAMAAYNAGPGKVKRGIAKLGTKDFWALAETKYLKPETKHYVPKVLGALILASDPITHGFDVTANPHDLPADGKVTVTRPVKLFDVASKMGLSHKLVARWNPELIHGITPPNVGKNGYELRLSQSLAEKFQEIEDNLPQLEVSDVKMHRVERGETLAKIARRYNVRINQILSINPDIRATALRVGRSIAVPVPSVVERERDKSGASHG